MTRTIAAVGFASLATLVAGTALAQEESTAKATVTPPPASAAVSTSGGRNGAAFTVAKPSVGLVAGYAFKKYYGVGLGLRGGYTLPMSVYVGGTFVYQIGGTLAGDVKVSLMYFGAEGGYDIAAGPLVVRPVLGLGLASVSSSTPGYTVGAVSYAGIDDTQTKFSLWPGVTVLYPIGNLYVGGDLRYNLILGYDADEKPNAFGIFVNFGMTF
jgi:hypothetical protein